jgi:hypothetical protein
VGGGKVVDSALTNFAAATADLDSAVASQVALVRALAPPHIADPVERAILQDAKDILSVVQSLRMINSVPPVTMEVVTGFGEIWSAQTLHAYLQTQGVPTAWLDARQVRDSTLRSEIFKDGIAHQRHGKKKKFMQKLSRFVCVWFWVHPSSFQVLIVKSDSNNGLGEKGAASTGGVVPLWDQTAAKLATWWNTVKAFFFASCFASPRSSGCYCMRAKSGVFWSSLTLRSLPGRPGQRPPRVLLHRQPSAGRGGDGVRGHHGGRGADHFEA